MKQTYGALAELLVSRMGFDLEAPASQARLGEALEQRMRATGSLHPEAYLRLVEQGDDELLALAELVTVGETYFFRQAEQLRAFMEVAVPARLAAAGPRPLRVLSAGCSTGEEPYTLAMLLDAEGGCEVPCSILGVDLNARALERARLGLYSTWSLRDTPTAYRDRYFLPEGRSWRLTDRICRKVELQRVNLLDADAPLWSLEPFDAIFCRNVLIYLSRKAAASLVERLAGALLPGGFLFLGHAETLRGLSKAFDLRHEREAFFYQRRATADLSARPPVRERTPASPAKVGSWIAAIRQSSARISDLAQRRRAGQPPTEATAPTGPPPELALAHDLVAQERFDEALALLAGLPPLAQDDLDARLLQAAVLTNQGRIEEAEAICRRVLERDALNAGAQYLIALCREHAGDPEGAAEADRLAIHLEPDFAMPHLHLGLLLRRAGHLEAARASLERARNLLPRQDAASMVLFGGGFGRDALERLCASEIRAAGGEP